MTNLKRISTIIVIALLLVVGYRLVQFIQKKIEARKIRIVEKIVPVHIATISLGNIEDNVDIIGEIHGINEADVYSKVPGKFVKKIAEEGKFVKAGEVIALIDRDEPAMEYKAVEIIAPISGILTNYFVDIGQTINPQVPLAMVADTAKIKVVAHIPEKDISRIKINDPAQIKVDSYPDKEFSGKVTLINAKVDSETRTIEINVEISNQGGLLKSGMFAKGRVIKKAYQGILVPLEAVLNEINERIVYVTDGKYAAKRKVITGLIQDGNIEIKSGIKIGEQLVVEGQDNLQDGNRVEVVQ